MTNEKHKKDELDKFLDRYNDQQHELSGWISEYRAARAEVERLKQQAVFNDTIIEQLQVSVEQKMKEIAELKKLLENTVHISKIKKP